MAVNLSTAQSGDVFLTQGGRRLMYLAEKNDLSLAPYSYCLKCQNTGDSYYYSENGIYCNSQSFPMYDLACTEQQVRVTNSSRTRESHNNINTDGEDNWVIALKSLAWLVFIASIITSIALFSDYQMDIAWIPPIYGIVQLISTMVLANISTSLQKSNIIQNEILRELKKQNK